MINNSNGISNNNEIRTPAATNQVSIFFVLIAIIVGSTITLTLCIYNAEIFKNAAFLLHKFTDNYSEIENRDTVYLKKEILKSKKQIAELEKKLNTFIPQENYFIINTTQNTFVLRNRYKIIRKGLCSTGSYTLLHTGDDKRFIFKTPKGMFRIQGKVANPVWIKPDWAFIEEGLPIPPKGSPDRYESGTLGDYAMSLGQGYLIHGTLYQRFLGMPVTHGCVRLGDDDLEATYKALGVGSKVFIY